MSDPECGDGGGERQQAEAAVGRRGEDDGTADHGQRRTFGGRDHGEIADARERGRDLLEALADEGDGVAVAAGDERAPAAGQRRVANAEPGARIGAGDRLDRAGGEAGAVVLAVGEGLRAAGSEVGGETGAPVAEAGSSAAGSSRRVTDDSSGVQDHAAAVTLL